MCTVEILPWYTSFRNQFLTILPPTTLKKLTIFQRKILLLKDEYWTIWYRAPVPQVWGPRVLLWRWTSSEHRCWILGCPRIWSSLQYHHHNVDCSKSLFWIQGRNYQWALQVSSQITAGYLDQLHGTNLPSFSTAGRMIKTGLTASVIVSQWTWAATLLQSSNVAWQYGVSGPFW